MAPRGNWEHCSLPRLGRFPKITVVAKSCAYVTYVHQNSKKNATLMKLNTKNQTATDVNSATAVAILSLYKKTMAIIFDDGAYRTKNPTC